MDTPTEDRTKEDYWNWRVKAHDDQERMIWYGQKWKWDAVEMLTKNILSVFQNCTVLDVGCGYGRIASLFAKDKYLGIDFSSEMIALAKEKNPGYRFEVQDKDLYVPEGVDVIVSVMSGKIDRYEQYARIATVVIGSGQAIITYHLE